MLEILWAIWPAITSIPTQQANVKRQKKATETKKFLYGQQKEPESYGNSDLHTANNEILMCRISERKDTNSDRGLSSFQAA
jgi:hypothetical protein